MDWRLARSFTLESHKREIEACDDVEKLRSVCVNLMLQAEALREMVGDLLLRQ
jgi:hypothetical protein